MNEAFAAQVLSCLAAWEDDEFCKKTLGLSGAAGTIPRDRLNIDGGAIGIGHPVGASGNRIVLHLINAMHRLGLKRGIATEYRRGSRRRNADRGGLGKRMKETYTPALDVLGQRDLELGPFVDGGQGAAPWIHWKLRADEDGIVWLLLDKKGTGTNTLSEDVLTELDGALAKIEQDRPRGLVIRSAKQSGFIAGADINEFRGLTDPTKSRPLSRGVTPCFIGLTVSPCRRSRSFMAIVSAEAWRLRSLATTASPPTMPASAFPRSCSVCTPGLAARSASLAS